MAELTYRLFMVATAGMLAGTVYLLMSSREVDPKFRRGVYISALVTGIAWYHYQKMTVSFASGDFDTPLRYVDWVLTVPLMFVEVLAVTSKGAEYAQKVRTMGAAALVMIGGGYYGEVSAEAGDAQYWTGFVVSMVAYAFLMRALQAEGTSLTGDAGEAFQKIKNLILIGWIIYPLGFLAPAVSPDLMDLRELLYTIADIINKVGLGVLVLNMAKVQSGEKV
ncbi:MAG: bacteriorhodopsin [Candidatus Actinomarina sp.]|jgi:bacteriorhodopsin|nr:bacteriorhodopsin-like [Candidatus Actinomarina sp.]MDA9862601.1 bacteriorhodopsin-like [Acidimicrobiia bacterium]MDA9608363.1 bacteriorhodopsin-like [Candidatus Actinomarina sp.]MDG1201568.1 bacteriorhodopsin [Candidatus Actinomarina sp.]MDG1228300.1 bacteriorhodopsin [Candidatus Actinomarina sp.]